MSMPSRLGLNIHRKEMVFLWITVPRRGMREGRIRTTPNPPTNIVGFRGFDPNIILIVRGGIPRPMWNFPESLSQAMLVGVMLVGDWAN